MGAIPSVGTNYSVIVNQVGPRTMKLFEDPKNKRNFLACLFGDIPNVTSRVYFNQRNSDLDGFENTVVALDDKLLNFLKESPEHELNIGEAKEVNADTFEDVKEKMNAMVEQTEKEKAAILAKMKKAEEQHE